MDTALHAIYEDLRLAQQAAQRLVALGIDQSAIQIVSAGALAVADADHVGGYGDSGEHMHGGERDHVGGYGDSGEHMHGGERDHVGGYGDSGEHMHGGERDRVGSFASVAPARKATPNTADKLQAAGLSPDEARSYAARLDAGAAVLLVQVSPEWAAQAAEVLDTM
jgi:hypothetical protein